MKNFPGVTLSRNHEKQLSPQEILEIAWKRKWWLLIPIPISLIIGIFLLMHLPKTYRSSTLILVEPQKVPEDYVRSAVSGNIEDRLSTIRQQILSRSLLHKIINEYGLYKEELKKLSYDEVIPLMQKQIEIQTMGSRQAIDSFTISFEGNDPKTVMEVTNKLASIYIEENLKLREQLVEGTGDFLEKELETLKENLVQQENKITLHKQQNMGGLPEQLDANLRTLDRYQQELNNISSSLKLAEARKDFYERNSALETMGHPQDTTIPSDQEGFLNQEYAQLGGMKKELETLRTDYTDAYPDIITLKRKIKELEENISNKTVAGKKEKNSAVKVPVPLLAPAVRNEIKNATDEINSLKERQNLVTKKIQQLEKEVDRTPVREQEMTALVRDYDNTRRAYQSLLDKKYSARLSEHLEKRQKSEQFRIMDPANFPERPFKPNSIRVMMMCLGAGFGFGVGLVFLREVFDTSFKKPEDIKNVLGVDVLGEIPQFGKKAEDVNSPLSEKADKVTL